MALGKKENQFFHLYISLNDDFPYPRHIWTEDVTNNEPLESILKNSNLPVYEELFFSYSQRVSYVFKNRSLSVYPLGILCERYYPRIYFDEHNNRPSDLYYKGILVKDFRALYTQLPYKYHIFGVFNYLDSSLKLDVSRNEIIGGYKKLAKEFNNIILNYLIEKEDKIARKDVLTSILEYYNNEC